MVTVSLRCRSGRGAWLATIVALGLPVGCREPIAAETRPGPADARVDVFRMKAPGGGRDVDQASGLCYGRIGPREGLWVVCDRNGSACANHVFLFAPRVLAEARPGGDLAASESFAVVGPADGWERFAQAHPQIPSAVMNALRRQMEGAAGGPVLDLEGIVIGRVAGEESRLFVLAEEPNSLVLELRLEERDARTVAALAGCFAYEEGPAARGADANDGLEGIAWMGRPGEFYLAEEGTEPHNPSDALHFWRSPRLMRAELSEGRVRIDESWSASVTGGVRALRHSASQTLDALTPWDDRTLLAVDRNGGQVLVVDVRSGGVRPYLNLYDPSLLNLRQRLDRFPGPRRMPYVSIEGVARDANGDLWMVDDPAMPESFRASCIIRLRRPPGLAATTAPSGA